MPHERYIEVDVSEGPNSPLPVNRMFSAMEEPRPVSRVWTSRADGVDEWWEVVGWSGDGPSQGYAAAVEDSGEGAALLLYGGDWGIRLKPLGSTEPWDLENPDQWGEPCLLLEPDTQVG